MSREMYDTRRIYCRQLGCMVPFKYCRTMNRKLPCSSIADCWHEYLDIVPFLQTHYAPDELATFLQPSSLPKLSRLVKLIESAREKASNAPSDSS